DRFPELFSMFGQLDSSSSRRYPGAGIGLYLCQRLLGLVGGRIWAESAGLGKGSTFHVAIPLGLPAPSPAPQAPNPARLGGLTVVICTSSSLNERVLERLLSRAGAKIVQLDLQQPFAEQVCGRSGAIFAVDLDLLEPLRDALAGREPSPKIAVLTLPARYDRRCLLSLPLMLAPSWASCPGIHGGALPL